MRNEQKVTWIAVLALLSNVNVHCQDLDECLHTIKDLSMKLIDCHQDLACKFVFAFNLKKLLVRIHC